MSTDSEDGWIMKRNLEGGNQRPGRARGARWGVQEDAEATESLLLSVP